jgi:hypothetical protein
MAWLRVDSSMPPHLPFDSVRREYCRKRQSPGANRPHNADIENLPRYARELEERKCPHQTTPRHILLHNGIDALGGSGMEYEAANLNYIGSRGAPSLVENNVKKKGTRKCKLRYKRARSAKEKRHTRTCFDPHEKKVVPDDRRTIRLGIDQSQIPLGNRATQ